LAALRFKEIRDGGVGYVVLPFNDPLVLNKELVNHVAFFRYPDPLHVPVNFKP
jgi:hypothetical protein